MAARTFLHFSGLSLIIFMMVAAQNAKGSSVPAMFIFGDSLIDDGNNNNFPNAAKANYPPYGIDFKGGPTGRFCNGYTMVDTIAELLGLPLIPSYLSSASGDQMRYGVNYASGAGGILDETGKNYVSRIPFNQQIKNFENTLHEMTARPGAPNVANALAKAIFFVGMGSNDYLNNYLMPNYNTRSQYNGQQYADLLVQQYSQQLSRLYNLGARKFVIAGLGPLGCLPIFLAQSNNSSVCLDEVNNLILLFNANIKAMINNLSANLPGSRFSLIDVYYMFQDLLANAKSYGFTVTNQGCCACFPYQIPCSDRKQYVFWDAFHPTEAVNVLFGRQAFNGNKTVVYPINIQQLVTL